jgi:hypothetical protein
VTEAEWLACDDVGEMLRYLKRGANATRSPRGRRKLRLFACGCCRQVWELIEDPRSRRLVGLSEALADGLADPSELAEAEVAARAAKAEADVASAGLSCMTHTRKVGAATAAALQAAARQAYEAARVSSGSALCSVAGLRTVGVPNPAWDAQESRQAALLRCLFGNPYRPVPAVDPASLEWNGGTVRKLAQAVYDERDFGLLPVLADALEDAGCSDPQLLGHLRGPGPHVRGCWAVDLILGKE